jgi:two-component system, chemotaxis family, protein-glutamate methylesterase/glutaminase
VTGQVSNREAVPAISHHHPHFDVIAMGASAGGIRALETILGSLPEKFQVGIAVVLHLSPDYESMLVRVLTRRTGRRVQWATEGARLGTGTIYVAPPDRHLEVDAQGSLTLATTPRVNFSRPSVDLLFTSAATVFGARTLAVLLTGNGADGKAGAVAVCAAGGVVIAQDEASSEYFGMPREAILAGAATMVRPLDAIASALTALVRDGRPPLADLPPLPNVDRPSPPKRSGKGRGLGD